MRHVRAIFPDSRRRYVSPVAGRSDLVVWRLPPSEVPRKSATGGVEHHLGECARTISSRDYASPGRFVFCSGERRSMVTNCARVLSGMPRSTRNCFRVRTPINSRRATSPQGKAKSSSLVSSGATVIGAFMLCRKSVPLTFWSFSIAAAESGGRTGNLRMQQRDGNSPYGGYRRKAASTRKHRHFRTLAHKRAVTFT